MPEHDDMRDAFLRFRDQHDLAALGEVFDATAQRLLLVAASLARRGCEAEDLVQATFVQAIRNAARYDAERPLVAWLVGILANEARAAGRRAARRPDPVRLPPERAEDPSDLAGEHELLRRINEAIDTLPSRWRDVLALHLTQGMTPTEIAHALRRPVGTVKSWLHRGLARLRGRLPTALAAIPWVPTVAPGLGLDLVRERILLHARAELSTVSDVPSERAGWRPTVTSSRSTLVAATLGAALVLPLMVWVTAVWSGGWVTTPPAHRPAYVPPADLGVPVVPEPPTTRVRVTDSANAAGGLLLAVRWADGTPAMLRGCVEPRFGSDPRLRRMTFTTDGSGSALVPWPSGMAAIVRLDRGVEHLVDGEVPGRSVELTVPSGRRVVGFVADPDGVPVVGATIWMAAGPDVGDGAFVAATSSDGTFALRDVPIGSLLAACRDGFAPTRAFRVPGGGVDTEPARVSLAFELPAGVVSIRVAGHDGRPVCDAMVQFGCCHPSVDDGPDDCLPPPPCVLATDARGCVTCRQVPSHGRVPMFVRAVDQAGFAVWVDVDECTEELQISLPRPATLAGCVGPRQEGAEASVVRAVLVGAAVPEPVPAWFHPQAVASADGTFRLRGLDRGLTRLEARGPAGRAQVIRSVVGSDEPEWRCELSESSPVCGRVSGMDPTLMAGHRVVLHAPGVHLAAEVAADGSFVLAGAGPSTHELELIEPEHVGERRILRRLGVTAGDWIEVVLPATEAPTSQVQGRVVGCDGTPLTSIELSRFDASLAWRTVTCDAEGRFTAGRLPSGRYLLLAGQHPYALAHPFELGPGAELDLGTLQASEPARCSVRIDATRAKERLHVALWHCHVSSGLVDIARWSPGQETVVLTAPAGEYRLRVSDGGVTVHEESVVLASDDHVAIEVPAALPGVTTATLHMPAMSAWTWFRWRIVGEGFESNGLVGPRRSGVEVSEVRFAAALPSGRYHLEATTDDGRMGTADFVVGDRATDVQLAVELR